MGFHSWLCKGCELSVRHGPRLREPWMRQAVAIRPTGGEIVGQYDGYGRIAGMPVNSRFSIYHRACWEILEQPEYTGSSKRAADQGMSDLSPPEPQDKYDLLQLRGLARDATLKAKAEAVRWKKQFAEHHTSRPVERQKLILRIGDRLVANVTTLEEAQRIYEDERDASGEGASTWPTGQVGDYRISYNGRLWDGDRLIQKAPQELAAELRQSTRR